MFDCRYLTYLVLYFWAYHSYSVRKQRHSKPFCVYLELFRHNPPLGLMAPLAGFDNHRRVKQMSKNVQLCLFLDDTFYRFFRSIFLAIWIVLPIWFLPTKTGKKHGGKGLQRDNLKKCVDRNIWSRKNVYKMLFIIPAKAPPFAIAFTLSSPTVLVPDPRATQSIDSSAFFNTMPAKRCN